MSLLKNLSELLDAGVITPETATRIETYYRTRKARSAGRLVVVFSALGSLLVGLGIILIIAHNWDELSRNVKSVLAFLPVVAGQALCGYTLIKKFESVSLREASALFLALSVGACISLVSQIYQIPGDLSKFLFTWMLLSLPLVYLMRSSLVSLMYLVGVTWYGVLAGYAESAEPAYVWPMLIASLPFYYQLILGSPASNFTIWHHWFFASATIILLGTVGGDHGTWLYVAYISLFGAFVLIGNFPVFQRGSSIANAYQILGGAGTLLVLIFLSFVDNWSRVQRYPLLSYDSVLSAESIVSLVGSIGAGALYVYQYRRKFLKGNVAIELFFIFFGIIFIIGVFSSFVAAGLVNAALVGIALLIIRDGSRQDHLGILNLGLGVIMILAVCRFFDTDISFVLRGILFVLAGVGFFIGNYRMIRRRKTYE